MKNNDKWFNILMLVDILIFILPPVGIYGIIKNNNISLAKKTPLIGIATINLMCILAYIIF
ncbi:MAG: hypothetical protein IMY72_12830 [Bacteroidetes bacterium]|nr:hypothetical protein [Bacteroidota bacterium]